MLEKLLRKTIWEQVNRAFEQGRIYERSLIEGKGAILSINPAEITGKARQDIEEIMKGKGL